MVAELVVDIDVLKLQVNIKDTHANKGCDLFVVVTSFSSLASFDVRVDKYDDRHFTVGALLASRSCWGRRRT